MMTGNEEAVAQFLEEKIHFQNIPKVIENASQAHKNDQMVTHQLDDVHEVDAWARKEVKAYVSRNPHSIINSDFKL